jgi:hypothetical protein
MKLVGAIGTTILSLTLGVGIPAYAQQDQHDQQEENKDKPAQEKEKQAKPTKQEEKNAQQEKNVQQEKNAKAEDKKAEQEHPQLAKPVQQEQHAGGRIPEDRYKANFGQEHRFRVNQADYSSRRFQYGGYWFGFVGVWPSNWLYTQDVYVVDINGVYYLCNANYPGVNIALVVTL